MRFAHTPDADDAFMFYAITARKIPIDFEVESIVEDIESLNKKAFKALYEVTALSVHAYAYVSDKYRILSSGASVGEGYGPIVVAKEKVDLEKATVAIPGKLTTASLLLNVATRARTVEMRFDEIIKAVVDGKIDAGLLIHEGQLSYKDYGLKVIMDLYEWWFSQTKLPLPLGINVIRRDLREYVQLKVLKILKGSVRYALENFEEAFAYAKMFSRDLDDERLKKFVKWYVNEYTLEMPQKVVKAMEKLLEMAEEKGIVKKPKLDVLYES